MTHNRPHGELYAEIGRRLQKYREDRGMSQLEFGKALSPTLTRSAVSSIEKGRQNVYVHTLFSAARVLSVPVTDLLPLASPTTDPLKARLGLQLERLNVSPDHSAQIWETLRGYNTRKRK